MISKKRYLNYLIYLQLCLQIAPSCCSEASAGSSAASSSSSPNSQPVRLKPTVVKQSIKSDTLQEPKGYKFINVNEADEEDGLYLLGLFDVHQASSSRAPFKCGPIELDPGELSSRRPMQNLAAFLWAIDQINQDSSLLPGIKLGSLVMDTCSSFLRTNQQLANLLHPNNQHQPQGGGGEESSSSRNGNKQLPGAHQLVAIVADNYDWQSVEAVTSMASAIGVTTFVTQSRSTKLNELARRYALSLDQTRAQWAASGGQQQQRQRELDERLLSELLGIGRMMTAPIEPPAAAATVPLQAGDTILQDAEAGAVPAVSAQGSNSNQLLMIRMLLNNEIIADSLASLCDTMKWDLISVIYDDELDMVDLHDELIRQLFLRNTQLAHDEQIVLSSSGEAPNKRAGSTSSEAFGANLNPVKSASTTYATTSLNDSHSQSLERVLLNLAKKSQFGARVVVSLLGLNGASNLQSQLHKLRQKLSAPSTKNDEAAAARGEQLKQLNSLVWITVTDREPYYSFATDSLGLISVAAGTSSLMADFKSYYDTKPMAQQQQQQRWTAANSSSPADSYNKWWPEYLKAVLVKQAAESKEARGFELLANECAKWLEPKASPLNEKCRSLSLSSLVELERANAAARDNKNNKTAASKKQQQQQQQQQQQRQQLKLSKYLAAGWEHNGMSVINSVLAIANGLESIRQSLCPEQPVGMCQQMRHLIQLGQTRHTLMMASSLPQSAAASSALVQVEQQDQSTAAQSRDANRQQQQQQLSASGQVPMISELLYSELARSTFQLADGQMFSLDDGLGSGGVGGAPSSSGDFNLISSGAQIGANFASASSGTIGGNAAAPTPTTSTTATQLDAKVKFYNLRLLRPNLIGFVKIAHFDQQDGLMPTNQFADAVHYDSTPADFNKQKPLKQVQSTCLDERRCLMLNSLDKLLSSAGLSEPSAATVDVVSSLNSTTSAAATATNHDNNNKSHNGLHSSLSDEELAERVNSLFKLDHPLITQPVLSDSSSSSNRPMTIGQQQRQERPGEPSQLAAPSEVGDLGGVRTMRSQPQVFGWRDAFSTDEDDKQEQQSTRVPMLVNERRQFEVIVLLPLHVHSNRSSNGGRGDNSMMSSGDKSTAATATTTASGGESAPLACGPLGGKQRIDEAHAFQQLAALAYAQALANGQRRQHDKSAATSSSDASGRGHYLDKLTVPTAAAATAASMHSVTTGLGSGSDGNDGKSTTTNATIGTATTVNDNNRPVAAMLSSGGEQQQQQQQVALASPELVVSVIDYCGQIELIEERLLAKLALNERLKRQQVTATSMEVVAIVDFDSRVSKHISLLLSSDSRSPLAPLVPDNLLHLTIATPTSSSSVPPPTMTTTSDNNSNNKLKTLRVDLLPAKEHEIDALIRLLKSLPSHRLVHLIYTDRHEYRDEFVRRANEANICVSKLIWVPSVAATSATDSIGTSPFERQLRLTSQLFQRELYDYSQSQSAQVKDKQQQRMPVSDEVETGLNSTRVLVVLASSDDATNRLIWQAASQSMLNDYVWLTSHEWLNSVEMPAELGEAEFHGAPELGARGRQQQSLPRYLISTKMETFQGHAFRQYFAHLTPALHAPIPTDWFDEFWQQHFKCRLPLHASSPATAPLASPATGAAAVPPELCQLSQRLEWNQMIEDDRVHYTVRALESIYLALDEFMQQSSETTTAAVTATPMTRPLDARARELLALNFKSAFDKGRGDSSLSHAAEHSSPPVSGKAMPLVGFHFVHRLLAPTPQALPATARRTNSRHLSPSSAGRLVRIGLWRHRLPVPGLVTSSGVHNKQQSHHLFTLLTPRLGPKQWPLASGGNSDNNLTATAAAASDVREQLLRSPLLTAPDAPAAAAVSEQSDEEKDYEAIRASLDKLASIKSRCSTPQTCSLCKQQIAQTQALIRQQEARLSLSDASSSSSGVPRAISSMGSAGQFASSLDSARFESNFFDDQDQEPDEEEEQSKSFAGSDSLADGKQARSSAPSGGKDRDNERRSGKPNARQADSGQAVPRLDDIQAAASSLFDSRTSQQVSSETRRAYSHYLNHQKLQQQQQQQSQAGAIASGHPLASGLRQHSGALMSILSLIGIVFTVASMTYFYPNMLDYQSSRWAASLANKCSLHNNSFRSTTSSTCNMIADDDEDYGDSEHAHGMYLSRSTRHLSSLSSSSSLFSSISANINDYLILIGLLMLYSINIAFLLPATMSVCSFRRVGLSVSYTILFSAILVRIMTIARLANSTKRQRTGKRSREQAAPRVAADSFASNGRASLDGQRQQQEQQLESVDESVEVTFESLPYDYEDSGAFSSTQLQQQPHQQQQLVSSISANQQYHSSSSSEVAERSGENKLTPAKQALEEGSSLFHLPLILLISQFFISLSWLVKQPPEPTLFQGCWHCSSPRRSPLLFHYEPLLSLIQPALLLLIAWLWSIELLRTTAANREQYQLAIRRFLSSQPLSFTISNNPEYSRLKQRQYYLGQQLRESKSLLATNTLLVLAWSLLARTTINSQLPASFASPQVSSHSHSQFSSPAASAAQTKLWPTQSIGQQAGATYDTSLVLTNLVSGTIIFCLLFVYRLRLFSASNGCHLWPFKRARSQYNSIKSSREQAAGCSSSLCGLKSLLPCCPCGSSSASSTGESGTGGQLKLFKNCRRGSSQSFAISNGIASQQQHQRHQGVHKFNRSSETDVDHSGGDFGEPVPRQLFGTGFAAVSGAASVAQISRGQERLRLKQFNTYGTYCGSETSGGPPSTIADEASGAAPKESGRPNSSKLSSVVSSVRDSRKLSLFNNRSKTSGASGKTKNTTSGRSKTLNLQEQPTGSAGKKQQLKQAQKVQRRQSNGSQASAAAASKRLVVDRANQMASSDDSDNDDSMLDTFDTISCAASVASNATSQLQGNELYPIDCSIQLDNCNAITTSSAPQVPDQQQ